MVLEAPGSYLTDTRGETSEKRTLTEEVELSHRVDEMGLVGETGPWTHHFGNIRGVEGNSEIHNSLGALEQGCQYWKDRLEGGHWGS